VRTFLGLMLVMLSCAYDPAFAEESSPVMIRFDSDASCPVEATIGFPEDYYPPGAIRRVESGEVVLEITVEAGARRVSDVTVAKSSGFPDLDNASLKLGRALKISALCGSQRLRLSVLFEAWRDPLEKPSPGFGCLGSTLPRPVTTVLMFPYEGE
jgi:TonB family protein